MMSKDSAQDQELLDRYRQAGDKDAAAPSDAVRSAIFAESRRVAEELATKRSAHPFDVSRPAANDSRWKITAFGTAGAALLAALLIVPHYWESLPTSRNSAVPASARSAMPAAAETAAAPRPKLESIAPAQHSESLQALAVPQTDSARQADARFSKRAQNYAPPAPPALGPAPARAARVPRERSEYEPASLETAAAAGNLAQTTLLLDRGAAVNTRDALGRTPLLVAVTHNKLEAVRLLLARGADPNAADNAGLTPLQLAKNKDLRDIAALLERAGAR
ncbi:MAG TPA: ankyrin repeat domain-containing protein [Steroidobacteraceae bacterium]|nr:ankyrin repeat domain-containing protein [Steroidobacteraceae bacterium]